MMQWMYGGVSKATHWSGVFLSATNLSLCANATGALHIIEILEKLLSEKLTVLRGTILIVKIAVGSE